MGFFGLNFGNNWAKLVKGIVGILARSFNRGTTATTSPRGTDAIVLNRGTTARLIVDIDDS